MKPFDESGIFRPALGGDGLRRVAVRSAGVTVLSQGLAFAVQMGATVVLARLLMPRDFGLVAMVSTLSLLLMNCGLNGFTEAVIQRNQINHGLVSNLFWINAGLGVLLALGFAAGGPLLARFYGDPRVAHVAAAMSIAIFITTVSVQHLALLKRAMQFALVSANDIVARTVSVIVSILLAWAGWGYWALVAGAVALPLATSIGAWILCRWVPGLPSRRNGTVPMVRFAMSTYGRFTASYFTNNLDNLLVGWRFGAAPLGFYKKAYDLFVLPTNQLSAPLTSVAVSTLSRLDPNSTQYRHYFLRALSALAFVGFGLGAGLTLVGGDLIRLLLGPGWEEAGRIFRFFGPGIGIMLLYFTHGWIHLSIGRADRWLRWGMVELSVTASLFLVGLTRGPIGIESTEGQSPHRVHRHFCKQAVTQLGERRHQDTHATVSDGHGDRRSQRPKQPVRCGDRRSAVSGERIGCPFEREGDCNGREFRGQQQNHGANHPQLQITAIGRPDIGP